MDGQTNRWLEKHLSYWLDILTVVPYDLVWGPSRNIIFQVSLFVLFPHVSPIILANLMGIQTVYFNSIFWPQSGFYVFLGRLSQNNCNIMVTPPLTVAQGMQMDIGGENGTKSLWDSHYESEQWAGFHPDPSMMGLGGLLEVWLSMGGEHVYPHPLPLFSLSS